MIIMILLVPVFIMFRDNMVNASYFRSYNTNKRLIK